ncbi:hypothetical protein HAZT_HAZT002524 [Hyalella azteca]|uniref:Pre-mRNA-splicing factor SPF27 n=1 Tax=Hyalella azteca TaxID=294128 RepID=A0A6A0GS59_HYAAZ|nr:hypothetical protein HAZT_HAZT002524 [Hyalella azteca]
MVEDEKKRYRPTKNYLEHLPPLNLSAFETEIMRNEFERLSVRQPMDTLSMKRYELPPPPPGKMTDVSAWSECVDNSFAQLEHQATRKAVQEVNWARKSLQCKAGEELRHLESTWVSLVSRNYDIEQACVNLQQQLQRYSELLEAKRDNHDNNNASDQEM